MRELIQSGLTNFGDAITTWLTRLIKILFDLKNSKINIDFNVNIETMNFLRRMRNWVVIFSNSAFQWKSKTKLKNKHEKWSCVRAKEMGLRMCSNKERRFGMHKSRVKITCLASFFFLIFPQRILVHPFILCK